MNKIVEVMQPETADDIALLRYVLDAEATKHSGRFYTISISLEYAPVDGWFTCYWSKPADDANDILSAPMISGEAAVSIVSDQIRILWRAGDENNVDFIYLPTDVMRWKWEAE